MQNRIDQLATGNSQPKRHEPAKSAVADSSALPSQLTRFTRIVETGIAEHPAISLGVGLAIGAALGWFLKRK